MKAQWKIGQLLEFAGNRFSSIEGVIFYKTHVAYVVTTDEGRIEVKDSEVKNVYALISKTEAEKKSKKEAKPKKERMAKKAKNLVDQLNAVDPNQTEFSENVETEADHFA